MPLPSRLSLRCLVSGLLFIGSLQGATVVQAAPEPLAALGADKNAVSVVGISSGGYMATQLAVAFPERFSAVGVLAAGPWGCAEGSLSRALSTCMTTSGGEPSLDRLENRRRRYESAGLVGPRETLSQLRVFLWHGEDDDVVDPDLGELLAAQWQRWLANAEQLRAVWREEIGHGWPISLDDDAPPPQALGDCQQGGGSYLLACDDDVAGEMLRFLYPEREENDAGQGQLSAFDQSDFAVTGMADSGFVYIPDGCEGGGCQVTLALHGCQMNEDAIGDTFVRHSGLNEWAALHQQIVLYPQAKSSMMNPQGCWDWWGYAERSSLLAPSHDTREGVQAKALVAMLERLQAAPEQD
ncbi:alpha/beta fold hydrolase [Halomonas sp. SH5A2]|uniref:alpha/beta fold hydrolase n=1 Tax=Halomonas sp. SH5A2 TaxID=2749040 RepID=UPI0016400035|nr:alpha/beta fold hydrolase [Halomonas sp. SH5A2]QNI04499.1 alpha/beta fold hydrolase [Halomonas sp. SH5A2]